MYIFKAGQWCNAGHVQITSNVVLHVGIFVVRKALQQLGGVKNVSSLGANSSTSAQGSGRYARLQWTLLGLSAARWYGKKTFAAL